MNESPSRSIGRWIPLACVTVALAACGGSGEVDAGTPSAAPRPAPVVDARSGNYTLMAVNGKEYTLALDFDASTYRVSGNGTDASGGFAASGDEFQFQPGNSVGATGTRTTRFTLADANTVVGELTFPEGALPFIAARAFEDSLAGAVGSYDMLGRAVNADGSLRTTTIQQGEVTAAGQLRTCEDQVLFPIADCPSTSVSTGTITVAGTLFTAQTSAGNVLFRIAKVGSDKIFLRASPSAAGTRRFVIGTPADANFGAGSYVGGTTEPAWGTFTLDPQGFVSSVVSPSGDGSARAGSVSSVFNGAAQGTGAILVTLAPGDNLFATGTATVGVVASPPSDTQTLDLFAIGRRR